MLSANSRQRKEEGKMKNKSGIQPVECKVLCLPDKIEEKTKGGLFLPESTKKDEELAQVKATLVAIGGNAFQDPAWNEPMPKIGDRVYVAKYAGIYVEGEDGEMYKLCNDQDIAAILIGEKNDE
jgi:chaperonin GroES